MHPQDAAKQPLPRGRAGHEVIDQVIQQVSEGELPDIQCPEPLAVDALITLYISLPKAFIPHLPIEVGTDMDSMSVTVHIGQTIKVIQHHLPQDMALISNLHLGVVADNVVAV